MSEKPKVVLLNTLQVLDMMGRLDHPRLERVGETCTYHVNAEHYQTWLKSREQPPASLEDPPPTDPA